MPPQPALTPDPDHLLIAYAASRAPGAPEALQGLRLPNLEKLLARLQPGALVAVDAESPDMPHERALAAALGLRTAPGHAPWAALQMRAGGGEQEAAFGIDLPQGVGEAADHDMEDLARHIHHLEILARKRSMVSHLW